MHQKHFHTGRGHIWAGFFLLIIGAFLLMRAGGVFLPDWLFTWPVLLIAIGIFIGLKHQFRHGGWIIPILIGSIFLIDRELTTVNLRPFIAPIIIISIGLFFILRPKFRRSKNIGREREAVPFGERVMEESGFENNEERFNDKRDLLDAISVFGGVKKNIMTKNFKGGDIVNFMGGSEINLTQADFNGTIKIDTTNVFGGTKLIVPSNWDIQSEVVAVFGGVDDKRQLTGNPVDPNKLIIIEGFCLFGGIEIRSF